MEDPVGFEPTTSGLEARCYILAKPRDHEPQIAEIPNCCLYIKGFLLIIRLRTKTNY